MDLQEKCKQLVVDYYNKRVDATDKKKITKNDAYKKWENVSIPNKEVK